MVGDPLTLHPPWRARSRRRGGLRAPSEPPANVRRTARRL